MKFFRNLKDEDYNTDAIFVPIIWQLSGGACMYVFLNAEHSLDASLGLIVLCFLASKTLIVGLNLILRNFCEKKDENSIGFKPNIVKNKKASNI